MFMNAETDMSEIVAIVVVVGGGGGVVLQKTKEGLLEKKEVGKV